MLMVLCGTVLYISLQLIPSHLLNLESPGLELFQEIFAFFSVANLPKEFPNLSQVRETSRSTQNRAFAPALQVDLFD